MTHYTVKRYLIFSFLLACIFYSISTFGTTFSNTDQILNDSFNTLTNIQKQLQSIAKNSYINLSNNEPNDSHIKQLEIYSRQLDETLSNLHAASTLDNTEAQNATISSLINVSYYLQYIQNRIGQFSSSTDPSEQFDILNTIFIANSLVDQIFAYNTL